jgi:uncharacterized FAD-dependent dehydrogenase
MTSDPARNAAIHTDYQELHSYRAVGRKYGLCAQRIKDICDKETTRRALIKPEDWTLDTLIAETTLPARIRSQFREHLTTFREVLQECEGETRSGPACLLRLPNFGRKSYLDLKAAMASKGWTI